MNKMENFLGQTPNAEYLNYLFSSGLYEKERKKVSCFLSQMREKLNEIRKLNLQKDIFDILYLGLRTHYMKNAEQRKLHYKIETSFNNLIKTELKLFREDYYEKQNWKN